MFAKGLSLFLLTAYAFVPRTFAQSSLDDWPNASPAIRALAREHETMNEILEAKRVIDAGRLPEIRNELLEMLDWHARAAQAVTTAGEDIEKRQNAQSQLYRTKLAVKNMVTALSLSPRPPPDVGKNATYFEKRYAEQIIRLERELLINGLREDLAGVAHNLSQKEDLRIKREKIYEELDRWQDLSRATLAEQDLGAARLLRDPAAEALALSRMEKIQQEEGARIANLKSADAWQELGDRIGMGLGYVCLGTVGAATVGITGGIVYAMHAMDEAFKNRLGCRSVFERIPTGEGLKLVRKYRSSLPKAKPGQIELDNRKYGPSDTGARQSRFETDNVWRLNLGDGVHLWLDKNSEILGGNDEKNKEWPGLAPRDVPEVAEVPLPILSAPKKGDPKLEIRPMLSSRSVMARARAALQLLRGTEPFVHGLAMDNFPGETRVATDDGRVRLRVRHPMKDSILELALPEGPPVTVDNATIVELIRQQYPTFEPRVPEGPLPDAGPKLFQNIRPIYAALQGNWGPQEYRGEGFTVRRADPEVEVIDSSRHLILRYNPHTRKTRVLLNPWELSRPPFALTRDMLAGVVAEQGPAITDFDTWIESR